MLSGDLGQALQAALEDPPFKTKDESIKQINADAVVSVLKAVRNPPFHVDKMSSSDADLVMKHVYYGFASGSSCETFAQVARRPVPEVWQGLRGARHLGPPHARAVSVEQLGGGRGVMSPVLAAHEKGIGTRWNTGTGAWAWRAWACRAHAGHHGTPSSTPPPKPCFSPMC